MTPRSLWEAIAAAERFVRLAKIAKAVPESFPDHKHPEADSHYITSAPERAAVKRASMDLTKALAQLRRHR